MSRSLAPLSLLLSATIAPVVPGADGPPVGFQARVAVRQPTRLDWEFVASGFGKDALKLPADYDSRQQSYQLFVPRGYKAERAWPLVVFISPGDAPVGWRAWQKVCEAKGLLYCEAYGAGNNCPPGKRIRIVLDMLDQVRRDYRIDPERSCVSGFSGGGRIACTVGYALPELFGGIVPIAGTNPLNSLGYLRHRVQDRLSVAFVTGETDFNRAENEKYMFPMIRQLGIRARLWVVPKLGHGMPGEAVLNEVHAWIEEDLPRRQADRKNRPLLACPPDDAIDLTSQAARLLEAAEGALKEDAQTWRGVSLIQGVLSRFPNTQAGKKARQILDNLKDDDRRMKLVNQQGGLEERTYLLAQAEALERFGKLPGAIQAYRLLTEEHPHSPEGRKALAELRRLSGTRTGPQLGVGLEGESSVVETVVPDSPADRAGLQVGDRIRSINGVAVASANDLRKVLQGVKSGERVKLTVDRKGKTLMLTVTLP